MCNYFHFGFLFVDRCYARAMNLLGIFFSLVAIHAHIYILHSIVNTFYCFSYSNVHLTTLPFSYWSGIIINLTLLRFLIIVRNYHYLITLLFTFLVLSFGSLCKQSPKLTFGVKKTHKKLDFDLLYCSLFY